MRRSDGLHTRHNGHPSTISFKEHPEDRGVFKWAKKLVSGTKSSSRDDCVKSELPPRRNRHWLPCIDHRLVLAEKDTEPEGPLALEEQRENARREALRSLNNAARTREHMKCRN